MYQDNTLMEIYYVVNAIITFVLFIVFCVMAWNIGRIRKVLTTGKLGYDAVVDAIELEKWKGNKSKVVELLHHKAYLVQGMTGDYSKETRIKVIQEISKDIAAHGGTVSEAIVKYIIEMSEKIK